MLQSDNTLKCCCKTGPEFFPLVLEAAEKQICSKYVVKQAYLPGDLCYVLCYLVSFASASNLSSIVSSWRYFHTSIPPKQQQRGKTKKPLLVNCGDVLKLKCIDVYSNLPMLPIGSFVYIVRLLYVSESVISYEAFIGKTIQ